MNMAAKDVDVQIFQFSLQRIVEVLREGNFYFETDNIMSNLEKSRLIENLFLKMPLLSGVFVQNRSSYEVIIGKEIVETLYSFVVEENFRLNDLEFFSDLNGMSFSDLPLRWRRYIFETIWSVSVIQQYNNTSITENLVYRYLEMIGKSV